MNLNCDVPMSSESWLMSLQDHSWLPLKGYGNGVRFPRNKVPKEQESKCYSCFLENPGGGSGELQVCHTHLNLLEGDGTNNCGNHFQACIGQKGNWKQLVWVFKQVCPSWYPSTMQYLVWQLWGEQDIYISKAFSIVSSSLMDWWSIG